MDTTIETVHSSLAQRIAKVRNCMFVEVATGVSPANKDLFVALCQSYEQQNVVISCLPNELQASLPHWIASISNLPEETVQSPWPSSMLSRNRLLWEQGIDFLAADWGDKEEDWEKLK